MNWRCSDFIMWKSVLANSEFFHRCRQCKCYNYAYNVSAVMNFCWRAVNKWSAINVYTTRYMFFIGYLHVIFIFFFSIMWTHFNDVFPQKLFKVINFWKDLYVLVLLIVQRRVSQVYLRSYFIKLALWCSNACKTHRASQQQYEKQDFVDLGPAFTCRDNLTMLFFYLLLLFFGLWIIEAN